MPHQRRRPGAWDAGPSGNDRAARPIASTIAPHTAPDQAGDDRRRASAFDQAHDGELRQAGGKKSKDGIRENPTNAPLSLAGQGVGKRGVKKPRKSDEAKTLEVDGLGALMEKHRQADRLAKRGPGKKSGLKNNPQTPTLESQGIDKNLAHEARKAARMPAGPGRRKAGFKKTRLLDTLEVAP